MIITFKGQGILIDSEDFNKVNKYCWHVNKQGYAVSRGENDFPILLHRIIMKAEKHETIDHKKHNLLDNRKSQLRRCTQKENNMNQCLSKRNTSGRTGVYWDKEKEKYNSKIGLDGKNIHLGYFDSCEEAVQARIEAEDEYFGEYSYRNSMKGE